MFHHLIYIHLSISGFSWPSSGCRENLTNEKENKWPALIKRISKEEKDPKGEKQRRMEKTK